MQLIRHRMYRWLDQIAGLSTFFYRLIFIVTQAFQDSCFGLYTRGKLRRFGLVHFSLELSCNCLPCKRYADCRFR